MTKDSLAPTLRLLHHALRLPAALWRGEVCCLTMPEGDSAPPPSAEVVVQFSRLTASCAEQLLDSHGRHFLALRVAANAVIVLGPYFQAEDSLVPSCQAPALTTEQRQAIGQTMVRMLAPEKTEPTSLPVEDLRLRENMSHTFSHPPFFLEQELAGAIMQGDHVRALRALGEINRLERARVADDPLRSLKNSLIGSCALCSRAAISGGVMADVAFTLADELIRTIENKRDVKALAALEEDMVVRFSAQVAALRDSQVSSIVRGAMRYIDDHLSDRLRVGEIACQVYVHPDYLSVRFKQETGEGISRYIQRRRIQEACRFLRYSAYPIAQIAGYFQFSSQSAFTKVFKQYQGLTPRQYREWGPASAEP
ncbi:MAG: helix-turn-helix domain-containing protein [Christensenellales bacterium]|jgi:two-component system response regulator YesN